MSRKNHQTLLKVCDNGVGIPTEKINSPQSLGLLGIRERLLVWNGTVTFESEPGKGTTVIATIATGGPDA